MDSVFYIAIDGADVTSNFTSAATSISVTDSSGAGADSASIDVSDTDGLIGLPTKGDPITIGLGRTQAVVVFEGTVEKVTSSGSRGGGRTLSISAKSADTGNGKAKSPRQAHKDNAKLGDVAMEWGQKAGIEEVLIHADLASIERSYWSMNGESFLAWGERTARSIGATFKVMGRRAVMVPRSAGLSTDGTPLLPIYAKVGDNVLSWTLDTDRGRPEHSKFRTRRFDEAAAEWKTEDADPEYDTDSEGEDLARFSEADEDGAGRRSRSRSKESDRERGGGSIDIDGEPAAQAEGTVMLSGARAGVDGAWLIDSVTHTRSRGGGYTTSLSVKRPGEGVGKDSRESEADEPRETPDRTPADAETSPSTNPTAGTTPPPAPAPTLGPGGIGSR